MPHALSRLAAILLTLTLFACDQRPVGLVPETADVEWSEVASTDGDLRAISIWASAPNDVYVGRRDGLLHFDGTSWEPVGPLPDSHAILSVWGSGPGDVYAANAYTLYHFNGASWSDVGRPALDVRGTAAHNVFVSDRRVVSHFNGMAWDTVMTAPPESFIRAVAPLPEGGVVVAERDAIAWWDGAVLTRRPPPTDYLDGLWAAAADDVYAIGPGSPGAHVVWHWDGGAWSIVASPSRFVYLNGIMGSGPGDVCAVGGEGTVLELEGASWQEAERLTWNDLEDVWVMANGDALVVSRREDVLARTASGWSALRTTGPAGVQHLFVESPSRFAVTDNYFDGGGVHLYIDGNWQETVADVPVHVSALGGTSLDDLHAALSDNRMMHFDGTSWLIGDSLSGDQWAIAAVSSAVAFSVGYRTIHRYDGTSWVMERESEVNYTGVWAADETVAYAAGGEFLRRNASGWHLIPLPEKWTAHGVWGLAANDVYIAAERGLLHFDGRQVTKVPPFEEARWYVDRVVGKSPTDILAASSRFFYQFDGSIWSPARFPLAYANELVQGVDGSVWAVGYDPAGWDSERYVVLQRVLR